MTKRTLLPLTSVREIVDAFGGNKAVAHWAGVSMPFISQWLKEDRISPGYHYRMDREMRRRGYLIDPRIFDDVPEPHEMRLLEDVAVSQ